MHYGETRPRRELHTLGYVLRFGVDLGLGGLLMAAVKFRKTIPVLVLVRRCGNRRNRRCVLLAVADRVVL
jgi:hypothetical protein